VFAGIIEKRERISRRRRRGRRRKGEIMVSIQEGSIRKGEVNQKRVRGGAREMGCLDPKHGWRNEGSSKK